MQQKLTNLRAGLFLTLVTALAYYAVWPVAARGVYADGRRQAACHRGRHE